VTSKQQTKTERTRKRILELLKFNGPSDANALAEDLGISAMAIRQHLYEFQKEGRVSFIEEPRPMGRPAKLWCLANQSDDQFPDSHDSLAVDLIKSIPAVFGSSGMEKLIANRVEQQVTQYQELMPKPGSSLRKKLECLVKIRSDEGYMADLLEEDGELLFVENHCPICAAATACVGLCAGELELFQRVLGEQVQIERVDHILAGERRCAYRVVDAG